MSTYAKITDYAAKDALLTGNPSKIVKGAEIGAEFDAIATADASNVKGPTSAVTDNAVVRWDTTTGRIAQGSSVTIDDTGNIAGTSFTGALNGTVGATTPSTGAFTTLSATSTASTPVVISRTGSTGVYQQFTDSSGSSVYVGASSGTLNIQTPSGGYSTKVAVSDTGLSVTGTSTVTKASAGDVATFTNGGATPKPIIAYSTSAYSGLYDGAGATGQGITFDATGGTVQIQTGSTTRGNFSSAGLAVTGALSATNVVSAYAGDTSTAFQSLNTAASNAQDFFVTHDAGNVKLGSARGALKLYSLNTLQATLDTSGNLGLGVTPSAWGASYKTLELPYGSVSSTTNATLLLQNAYFSGSAWTYKATAAAAAYSLNAGVHSWSIAPSGTAGTAITFTQAMTLDAVGNLLVGQTTSGAQNSKSHSIQPNGIHVVNHSTSSLTGDYYSLFCYNATAIGSITQSGTTAVLYNTTSDYRLKDVVGPVTGSGARLDALNPVEYTWKADGTHTRGFLAHEFQSVYAQSVNGTKDEVDEEGNPKYQSMQAGSSEVIADLVAEIKSLRARLAAAGIA